MGMSTITAVIASKILSTNEKPITAENITSLLKSCDLKFEEAEVNEVVEKLGNRNIEEVEEEGRSQMGSFAPAAGGAAQAEVVEEEKPEEKSESVDIDMDFF